MTASEKLTGQILDNAKAEAKSIADEANAKASAMTDAAKKTAGEKEAKLCADVDKKAERVLENARSAAALSVRSAVLSCRRDEIEKTVNALKKHLTELPCDRYFGVLERLLTAAATGGEGTVLLNSRDKARLPQSFCELLSNKNITLSEKCDDTLSGGFILKYGDIEYNCGFDALIADRREQLEDFISRELLG